jgi:hypothetical protein
MHSTGATLGDSAAKFGAHELKIIAHYPQQGSVWFDVYLLQYIIDNKLYHLSNPIIF